MVADDRPPLNACRVLMDRTILGRKCRPGDLIDLNDQAAAFLCEHGVVERVQQEQKPKAKRKPSPDAAPV